jgi:hypothetical protein
MRHRLLVEVRCQHKVLAPSLLLRITHQSSKVKAAVNIAVMFAAFFFAWRRWACNSSVGYPPNVVAG